MRKRMKKKFAAICISLAITLTGPGMSMVTMTYADEITKENQQDQEISNDQNNTKDGENSNTNDGKETENDLIQGNDFDSSQEKRKKTLRKKRVKKITWRLSRKNLQKKQIQKKRLHKEKY